MELHKEGNKYCFSSSSSSPPLSEVVYSTVDGVLGEEEVPELEAAFLQPRVVVYDGVCHLCHNGVKWLIKVDEYRQIKFCCLQSEAAEPYLNYCGVDREDVLHRFLFVEGPNTYSQGSTAALRIASYLPPPYSALKALMIIPTPLRDAVYDYVSKCRYDWYGKEEDCEALQDPEILQRFVDRKEIWDRCQDKYREGYDQ
ncbi:putative thiol-disulfide oxidoreductase DCC [Macleaya cordata]|uniref:Putative thiol-disulfide oxidoreductase DCC n=1 Tax=Macleaya cordata TaxID=56857 RepID=A0A200QLI9_MACCD|nr:putative thiol-disulfide oxidoreductase DCC [Macleaya cordata]